MMTSRVTDADPDPDGDPMDGCTCSREWCAALVAAAEHAIELTAVCTARHCAATDHTADPRHRAVQACPCDPDPDADPDPSRGRRALLARQMLPDSVPTFERGSSVLYSCLVYRNYNCFVCDNYS